MKWLNLLCWSIDEQKEMGLIAFIYQKVAQWIKDEKQRCQTATLQLMKSRVLKIRPNDTFKGVAGTETSVLSFDQRKTVSEGWGYIPIWRWKEWPTIKSRLRENVFSIWYLELWEDHENKSIQLLFDMSLTCCQRKYRWSLKELLTSDDTREKLKNTKWELETRNRAFIHDEANIYPATKGRCGTIYTVLMKVYARRWGYCSAFHQKDGAGNKMQNKD